jgi:3-oxoacyl-(acyl-carrier-protein) synthase
MMKILILNPLTLHKKREMNVVMSNTFGFGDNACVLVKIRILI